MLEHLQQELRIAEIRSKIQQDAHEGAEKAQRDYMLREQMKAIRKELGEGEEEAGDDLRQKIEDAGHAGEGPGARHERAEAPGLSGAAIGRSQRHSHLSGVAGRAALEQRNRRQPGHRPRAPGAG